MKDGAGSTVSMMSDAAVGDSGDPLALSPADRAWVDATLAELSTEEKVGQLFVLSSIGDDLEEIDRHCALG